MFRFGLLKRILMKHYAANGYKEYQNFSAEAHTNSFKWLNICLLFNLLQIKLHVEPILLDLGNI